MNPTLRSSVADVEGRVVRLHPALAVSTVVLGGYLAICAVFVAIGFLITHQWNVLARADDGVVRRFSEHRTGTFNGLAADATKVADTLGILVAFLVAAIVLVALRYRWELLFLVIAIALELATFITVNTLVDRPRPRGPRLGSLPSTSSFPSGHTAAMVVLYGGLALIVSARVRAGIAAVLSWIVAGVATAVVGTSRVYSAMHHPSDVVAGALVGVAVLAVAVAAVRVGQRAADERDRDNSAVSAADTAIEAVA